LRYGEAFAVIDFVKTTEFHENKSKSYKPTPDRILFEDYDPGHLVSALASKIEKQIPEIKSHVDSVDKEAKSRIDSIESRVDTFVTLTFVVISILFAALGFTQTRSLESSFLGSTVWLAAIALWFSMRTYVLARSGFQQLVQSKVLTFVKPIETRVPWKFEVGTFVFIALGLLLFQYQASRVTANSLREAEKQAQNANQEAESIKVKLESATSELSQLKTQNDELQKRVLSLEAKAKKK
jgi:F0F1-type ATP synthase epsilon subunit